MSAEYVEKIHGLLSHEDIEVVQQGLALLDSLVDSEAELRTYVPYPHPSLVQERQARIDRRARHPS